jgi:PTS system mannose-specific IIB component
MALVFTRVDCRLIHGQVIEAWLPFVRADYIVVANDEAADDPIQRTIMAIAVPPTVDVTITSVADAVRGFENGRWADRRVMLLLASCRDALRIQNMGLKMGRLNVGNLTCSPYAQNSDCPRCEQVCDLKNVREIMANGADIEYRPVPQKHPINLRELLESCQAT